MGVPGFFAWLLKQNRHNNIILNQIKQIDCLYLDANCLFHPKCFDILKLYPNETNVDKLEKLMIKRIISYIKYLINFTNPTTLIYIAVDGVAPLAKINQQRKRRYKSIVDNQIRFDLQKKHNMNVNNSWSNIVITPGTDFMKKLDIELEKLTNNSNLKMIYSSYKEEGEGEHKIIQYIKNNNNNNKLNNLSHVIYGLDADLIFLSLTLRNFNIDNIYLLREEQHLKNVPHKLEVDNVAEQLCFVSIENTVTTYNEYICEKINQEYSDVIDINFLNIDYCNDFIILCFLLGNDFLPHFPSIDIKVYGIDYVINAYTKAFSFNQKLLFDFKKKEINYNFLEMFLSLLADAENDFFTTVLPKHRHKMEMRKPFGETPYERELFLIENLKTIKILDPIMLGSDRPEDWKFRYYEHHFNTRINQQEFINNICNHYMEMFVWNMLYYFDKVPSWRFQYQFNHAPFISDLYKTINKSDDKNINIIKDKFKYNDRCIGIENQLLAVIPPQYMNLQTVRNKNKMNNPRYKFMFPSTIKLDYINKDQLWKCEPLMPIIDIDLLEE